MINYFVSFYFQTTAGEKGVSWVLINRETPLVTDKDMDDTIQRICRGSAYAVVTPIYWRRFEDPV